MFVALAISKGRNVFIIPVKWKREILLPAHQLGRQFGVLGPDYVANFSPASETILLKSNCRLYGEGFSPGRNSAWAEILARLFQTGLGLSAWKCMNCAPG